MNNNTENRTVWVIVDGGLAGFQKEEIDEFEKKFDEVKNFTNYWDFFNYEFEESLNGHTAKGYWNV